MEVYSEHADRATVLQAALAYHRLGWSIIPTRPGQKKAAGRWKRYQTERANEKQVSKWWDNGKGHGIAVILGNVSGGLVCRDFDEADSYTQWAAEYSGLAGSLPTVATGRDGGRHVYFIADVQGTKKYDDGELRASGGYCVLPPSKHPSGREYKWIIPLPDDGLLPSIENVEAAGFVPSGGAPSFSPNVTESTETTERTEAIEVEEDGEGWGVSYQLLEESLPRKKGNRNRAVFELARALQAVPQLTDMPVGNLTELKPVVQRWHKLGVGRGVIGTIPFEETWIDFLKGWPKVAFPKGQEPTEMILKRALENDLPAEALHYEQPQLRLLVALCREFQRAAGDAPFFLACRTAARLIGLEGEHSYKTAARWLFLLCHERVLALDGQKVKPGSNKAQRYRYLGG